MLNNKKIAFGVKLTSATFLLGSAVAMVPTLSSCSNPTNNETLIGSYDGTDWQGYISGSLRCSLREDGESVEIAYESNYKAHDLVIPDVIKYPNGNFFPLKQIYSSFNDSETLTGTLTLGKNIVFVFGSFNELPNVTGDLVLPNNLCDIYESFNYCGFDKTLFIGDMVQNIEESFFLSSFSDFSLSKYNFALGLATNVGDNCSVLVRKNKNDGTFLLDWNNYGSMVECLAFGELTIPNDVKRIGNYMFYGCQGLKGNLIIPDSVEFIGYYSFYNCGFDGKLSIGSNLAHINSFALENCKFSSLAVAEGNTNYGLATNVGNECQVLVAKTGENDFLVDYNNPNSVVSRLAFGLLEIPSSTIDISGDLLRKCINLTSISLEAGSTSLYKLVRSGPGEGGFAESISLNNPGFMININDIPGDDESEMEIKSKVPFTIGDLTIPDTISGHKVVAVGDHTKQNLDENSTFSGTHIGKLTTGPNLTTLYGSAFRECTISEVDLTNVSTIYESAFEGDTLTKVSIPKITLLSDEAFEKQTHIVSIAVDASVNPNTLSIIDNYGDMFGTSRDNVGELIDISGNGIYKDEWRIKLNLSANWEWVA